MSSKIITRLLGILFIISLGFALFLSWSQTKELKSKTEKLEATLQEVSLAKDQIEKKNNVLEEYYADCVANSTGDLWEIATTINTLSAYSNYAQMNPQGANQKELTTVVNKLLSKDGYVQYIETNGNKLYTSVDFELEGEFVTFKTDKAVRNGAIGISNCGSSNPRRTGDIIPKGKTVKILELCEAQGSKSVWAHIAF